MTTGKAKKACVTQGKVKDSNEAARRVLAWFVRVNSPATAQSLTDALGSRVSKPLVQRTLDALHAQQRLLHKDLKRVRFYYYNHARDDDDDDADGDGGGEGGVVAATAATTTPRNDDTSDSRNSNDDKDNARAAQATCVHEALALRARVRDKQAALAVLQSRATRAERAAQLRRVADDVAALRARVAELQAHANATRTATATTTTTTTTTTGTRTCDAVVAAARAYVDARRRWREYKAYTMQLVHTAATAAAADDNDDGNNNNTSVPDVMARMRVCTDEEAGVLYSDTAVVLPRALRV